MTGDLTCPFCDLDGRPLIEDGKTMLVIPNKFPYKFWDYTNVVEHLMLVPRRHIENLSEMNDAEKTECIDLIAKYEQEGYSIYGRSKANKRRSVPHQHIHLIKVADRRFKFRSL